MKIKRVCIFGSYKDSGKKEKEKIVKLGRLLAEKGFEVVSGGFGGTMEEVSRGAKEAGGKTIGVTYYRILADSIQAYRKKPNKYIDEEIKAKDIFERIKVMTEISDAFIVLPGGTGTLLEMAVCLELVNKGLMKPKPIIALGGFWKSVVEKLAEEPILSQEARSVANAPSCRDLVKFVENAEEAVAALSTALFHL